MKKRLMRIAAIPAVAIAIVLPVTLANVVHATQPNSAVRIVQRGLVKDCIVIQNDQSGLLLTGNGVNHAVTLEGSGNCFNLYDKFTYEGHTGYEYQNLDGHCLWQDGGVLELGGACVDNHPNEEFFGYRFVSGNGWIWMNVAYGPLVDNVNSLGCEAGQDIQLSFDVNCNYWNFPTD